MKPDSSDQLSIVEKTGYAMGDAAANLVWRGALAYLAVFYTDTLGIGAAAAAILLLVVRISDGITDIIMGMIADRTTSRHGKFRPWIIWSAPALGLFMVLSFTAPEFSATGKLAWAYFTYIGLTLAYTVNNVPYSALMGVMTPSEKERSVLSGYRFAGAFLGGALVMGFTPDLVEYFGQGDDSVGYQNTMYIFAVLLVALCCGTFFTTKERVEAPRTIGSLKSELRELSTNLPFIIVPLLSISLFFYYRDLLWGVVFAVVMVGSYIVIKRLVALPEDKTSPSQRDLIDLLTNVPWLLILSLGFLTMLFNGIKYGVIAYYFKHYLHSDLTGYYFLAMLGFSVVASLTAGYASRGLGKKKLFIISLVASGMLTGAISVAGPEDVTLVFVLGCAAEFFAAFMPVLIFSMLGDSADYSEWKNGRRATGLVYSAGTFIQKTGGGFAGALVLIVLAGYGYVGTDETSIANATEGMRLLMSWIPTVFAFVGVVPLIFYPLSDRMMSTVEAELKARRAGGNAASPA